MALEPVGSLDAGDVADRRVDVEVAHERVVDPPSLEAARAPHDQHHADAAVVHRAFASGNARPWSVVRITSVSSTRPCSSSAFEHRADPLVERAGAGLERRHVPPGRPRCRRCSPADGSRARRARTRARSTRGGSRRSRPTGRTAGRCPARSAISRVAAGATSLTLVVSSVDDVVVADVVRIGRDVLLTDQARPVAGLAEHVHDVALGVGEAVAAVGEAEHAGRVGALPGQQRGPRARAHRRGAERLAEQHALVGEVLDVRRRHRVPVRLDVAAGVVGVEVQDVRPLHATNSVRGEHFPLTCWVISSHEWSSCRRHLLPGVRDPAERQHPAVRAAEGHRGRGRARRVLRGPAVDRPAPPAPPVLRGCRRWPTSPSASRPSTRASPSSRASSRAGSTYALQRGTTPNGVFGAKMMWNYFDDFRARIAELPGLGGTDVQRGARRGLPRSAHHLRAPSRQGRPGGVAVEGDPDPAVARRRPSR